MSSAQVQSIDAITLFRAALLKFAETANGVLSEADAEMDRMLVWLESEQHAYWQGQIRRRTERVSQAKEAVRAKKLFRRADGSRPPAIEEEEALKAAIRQLEEANEKLINVRRYSRHLQKEILQYKGQAQRFAGLVAIEVPMAAGHLGDLVRALEAYLSLGPEAGEAAVEQATAAMFRPEQAAESMARPEPTAEAEPKPAAEDEGRGLRGEGRGGRGEVEDEDEH